MLAKTTAEEFPAETLELLPQPVSETCEPTAPTASTKPRHGGDLSGDKTGTSTAVGLPAAFSRLVRSNLAAQSAEQIGLAAAPIVAVFALGAGAGATGLLQTAQTLPFLILAIPAGLLADRSSRRSLMMSAEALRAASLLVILALASLQLLTLPLLAVLGFAGACGTVAYSVAAPSIVPALVGQDALASANQRLELARSVAFAAGPALAGALVGWIGASPAFGCAAALSLYAVSQLSGLAEPARQALPARRIGHDLKEGASFVFRHPLLRPILLTAIVFNTAFVIMQAVYVPYAVARLGLTPTGIGITLAAYGVGMVAGALAQARLGRMASFGTMVVIGPIAGLAAALAMLATLVLPTVLLATLSFFLIGAGPVLWTITTTTLRQAVTPGPLLGRVSAVILMATWGARPIGAGIGALIATLFGAEACLVLATLGFLVQAGIILASPVRRLAQQPAG